MSPNIATTTQVSSLSLSNQTLLPISQGPHAATIEGFSQDSTFDNLENLNVDIPVSHVVSLPMNSSNSSKLIMFTSTHDEECQNEEEESENDDFEMASYEFVDDDADLPDNSIMTIKQYKLLSKQINLMIKSLDSDQLAKAATKKVSIKIANVSKRVDELLTKFSTYEN